MKRCWLLAFMLGWVALGVLTWAFFIWLFVKLAGAHSPEATDPATAPWFRELRQPLSNGSCCSEQDCFALALEDTDVRDGELYVRDQTEVGHNWLPVPATNILQRMDNPTGKPVACIWNHQVICFVRASAS